MFAPRVLGFEAEAFNDSTVLRLRSAPLCPCAQLRLNYLVLAACRPVVAAVSQVMQIQ
jgi:hypothetical protein